MSAAGARMTEVKGVGGAPEAAAAAAAAVLGQCEAFLGGLSESAYTAPSARLMGSTIGQHVRHSVDHFAAALRALEGEAIAYDHRERNTPIESDLAAASARIRELRDALRGIGGSACAERVRVRVMLTSEGDEAELHSTLARELAFAAHHATHHHAMMAAIASEVGAACPAGFGKAPSTLHHERSSGGR